MFYLAFKNMRIGLLSFHKNYNYGWNLQCYALMRVLESLGHNVVLIDKRKFGDIPKYYKFKLFLSIIFDVLGINKGHLYYKRKEKEINRRIETFYTEYLVPRSCIVKQKEDYSKLEKFDTLVVGSDQVWREKLVSPITDYFFAFVDYNANLISYAASFGVDGCEYSQDAIDQCGMLIKRFKAVSVREQAGVKLIQNVYKWHCPNPVVVPDPTLLLNLEDYCKLCNFIPHEDGGLFCYILDKDEDKMKCVEKISREVNLKQNVLFANINNVKPSVEEWIARFRDAKFVFTDSFHGCVFSLIFRKPFVAYGNKSRGLSRFTSLLDSFCQSKRIIRNSGDLTSNLLKELSMIDCKLLDQKQNYLREIGLRYLTNSL